jgi:hypothetical protein
MDESTRGRGPDPRRTRLRKWVAIGALLALAGVPLATIPVAADSSAVLPNTCSTSFDPYTASAALLKACGEHSYPLLRKVLLPDGGTSYRYNIEGNDAVVNTPPAGFDARSASAATLELYGIPADPGSANPVARAEWVDMVSGMKIVSPPPQLISGLVPATQNSTNWAGQMGQHGGYTGVQARYTEPALTTTCSGSAAYMWAGLGGNGQNVPLAQNGTAQHAPGLGMDQGWYEILPALPVGVPITGTPGHDFEAFTTRGTGKFTFFFWDSLSDSSFSISVNSSSYNGDTAEGIVERVGSLPIENFGVVHFTLTVNTGVKVGDPNTGWNLVNQSNVLLATVGSFDFGGTHYDVTWKRCS